MLSGAAGLRVSLWVSAYRTYLGRDRGKRGAFRWTIPLPISNFTMVHEAMVLEYSGRPFGDD